MYCVCVCVSGRRPQRNACITVARCVRVFSAGFARSSAACCHVLFSRGASATSSVRSTSSLRCVYVRLLPSSTRAQMFRLETEKWEQSTRTPSRNRYVRVQVSLRYERNAWELIYWHIQLDCTCNADVISKDVKRFCLRDEIQNCLMIMLLCYLVCRYYTS